VSPAVAQRHKNFDLLRRVFRDDSQYTTCPNETRPDTLLPGVSATLHLPVYFCFILSHLWKYLDFLRVHHLEASHEFLQVYQRGCFSFSGILVQKYVTL